LALAMTETSMKFFDEVEGCDGEALWGKLNDNFNRKTRANARRLRKQLYQSKMTARESLTDFIDRARLLVVSLRSIDSKVDDDDFLCVLLAGLRQEYDHIVTVLEAGETLVLDDCLTKLRDFADRVDTGTETALQEDRILFAGGRGSGAGARASQHTGGRGRGSGARPPHYTGERCSVCGRHGGCLRTQCNTTCYDCGETGHVSYQCKTNAKTQYPQYPRREQASVMRLL
jgi:hypothetical protein